MYHIFEHFFLAQSLYEKKVLPVCQKFGLTYMEFTVLMFLANHPQYDTAAQIVKIRHLTKSHVSVSLRTLQEKQLVEGMYYPGNRKNLHLKVTDAAHPIVQEGRKAQKAFSEILVRDFTPEEAAQLKYLIEKLENNMKQENNIHE